MTKFRGQFRLASSFVIIFTLVTLATTFYGMQKFNNTIVMISAALNGAGALSLYAIAYEFGVAMTHPIGEAMSGGMINVLTNLFAVFEALVFEARRVPMTATLAPAAAMPPRATPCDTNWSSAIPGTAAIPAP